ncbi:MAG TPA: hypothetical protein PL189_14755 [bacterium]|nr:hypothetical protein [bacterium]
MKGKGFCIVLVVSLLCGLFQPVPAADTRTLAREAAAAIRAVENMQDNAAAAAKLKEIRAKLDQIRAADPNFAELRILESKYKRLTGLFGAPPAAPSAPAVKTGASAASSSSAGGGASSGTVSAAGKAEVLKDWEAIVALKKDFLPRLEEVIPVHVKNIIYDGEHADEALARIAALQQEAPAVKARVVAFGAKYGRTVDEIDSKIYGLTPKDLSLSLYDPQNQRPDESPGRAWEKLSNGLTNLEEAPRLEAKRILTRVLQNLDLIESFIMDTERDKRYAAVEEKLQMAARFSPQDAEVREWQGKIKAMRIKSKADIEKALDGARFPAAFAGFAGPGDAVGLAASALRYFTQEGGWEPNETVVKVVVAGNWVVAATNIFGEPIQWGLPIWAAAYRNDSKEIARVFRLTILTKEGLGVAKRPPWTGVWTGDSFRMRTANVR